MLDSTRVARNQLAISLGTLLCLLVGAQVFADSRDTCAEGAECLAAESIQAPELMLANSYREGVDLSAYWVSEKLDGMRAYWDGTQLLSRGGHLIQAPDWFIAALPSIALDGELWMGRGTFETLSGAVRRQQPDPQQWRQIRFMVFDLPGMDGPFEVRLDAMRRLFAERATPHVQLIEQFQVVDHEALMARLDAVVEVGGEGLMLHRADAPYRARRSDDLLKLKPYQDAEAQVIAHLPGQGKYQGMLGSLLVEDERGQRFKIGTGFSDAERRNPPPIGAWISFRHHGYTERGVPRFASFLRVRSEHGY